MSQGKDNNISSATTMFNKGNIWRLSIFLFLLSVLIYGNTIKHDFAQDDAIVITENKFTTQGLAGIPGLYKYDTFYGFFKKEGKDKLVAGGRYRPFTPMMFAIEYAAFGKKPLAGHLFNILYYGLLCVLIFHTFLHLLGFKKKTEGVIMVGFLAALIFAIHPIHTEVVANIKGRDEIMALLFSVLALYYSIKSIAKPKLLYSIIVFIAFMCGLLSKENTITYLAVIPLALYLFCSRELIKIAKALLPAILATIIFLVIRTLVLGADFGGSSMELMNNPFLKIEGSNYVALSGVERFSTIMYTLGKYLQLLLFPHPLTHDYYPRHISIMSLGDWQVWLSLVAYIILAVFAVIKFRHKNIPAFSILYFVFTLSIVSNIVFPIGTNMSERFLFMPSLGFSLLAGVMFYKYLYKKLGKVPFLILFVAVSIAFIFKTIHRNQAWENDDRLFLTDVHTSTNSAKIQNAAGGTLITQASLSQDPNEQKRLAQQAAPHLLKAIEIHPNYKNAHLLLGTSYYYQQKLEEAKKSYEKALIIDPDFADAQNNLAVTLRDIGRNAGQVENNLKKAISYLKQSYAIKSGDPETIRLLGVCYGAMGDHQKAIDFFERYVKIVPQDVNALQNLSYAYRNIGDIAQAEKYAKQALEISQ